MPDLVVTNAAILTMDSGNPRAEAIALSRGRIAAVGKRAEIEPMAGAATEVIDARGGSVLPGFVESHMHLFPGGTELSHLQLVGIEGVAAVASVARSYAAAHPDLPVIMGQGAHYAILDRPLDRHALDAIMPDRPFAIMAHDHHTMWANTAALRAAGLLHGAPMPRGHEVVLGADGTATGELREFEAFAAVVALAGEARVNLGLATGGEPATPPTAAERAADKARLLRGLEHCAAHGVTSIVNMDGNRYTLELLRELQAEGRLTSRVKVPFHMKPEMDLDALDRASAMAADFSDDWLQSGFVKMFMDGVIDSGTAFMLTDYADAPGHRGMPLFDPPRFAEICTEIDRRGLQIAVHAIGDAAVRATIDGYAAAQAANGARDSRHRIEHIEVIDRADVPRLAELGITASLQPPHPPGAMDFPLQPTMDRIGRDRWGDAYLCRTLAEAGATVVFASDWPVADISVLRGLQAALTRKPYPGGADERLGLHDCLAAYTSRGAWAARAEGRVGRLVPGLLADLVVLSRPIEDVPPAAIGGLHVVATVCGGRVTFRGPTG
ncbi:MAG: amidohydrolase [Gemmobacter sp.]